MSEVVSQEVPVEIERVLPGVNPDDIRKLQKIVALYESDNRGEREAALNRAQAFCESKGWGYKQGIKYLVRLEMAKYSNPMIGAFAIMGLNYEADHPGSLINSKLEREKEREAVVAEYGSLEAALEPCTVEKAIVEFCSKTVEEDEYFEDGFSSKKLVEAALIAHPKPQTMTAAFEELAYWHKRWEHRKAAAAVIYKGQYWDTSPEEDARTSGIYDLIKDVLLPSSLKELQQAVELFYTDNISTVEFLTRHEVWVKHLLALNDLGSIKNQNDTPQLSTRVRVLQLKTSPETESLSLRQLSKRLGVSHITVRKHIKNLQRDGLLPQT